VWGGLVFFPFSLVPSCFRLCLPFPVLRAAGLRPALLVVRLCVPLAALWLPLVSLLLPVLVRLLRCGPLLCRLCAVAVWFGSAVVCGGFPCLCCPRLRLPLFGLALRLWLSVLRLLCALRSLRPVFGRASLAGLPVRFPGAWLGGCLRRSFGRAAGCCVWCAWCVVVGFRASCASVVPVLPFARSVRFAVSALGLRVLSVCVLAWFGFFRARPAFLGRFAACGFAARRFAAPHDFFPFYQLFPFLFIPNMVQ